MQCSTGDTPKHWGAYLQHINEVNDSRQKMQLDQYEHDVKIYKALPWYKKIFADDPDNDMWGLRYYWSEKEPSVLDYWEWDTQTNGNTKKTK